jgi:hypothetical protein
MSFAQTCSIKTLIQNAPEDLFGQFGKGAGIFKLLSSDPSSGELCLDEAQPDDWFLLNVGTQFQLGRCDMEAGSWQKGATQEVASVSSQRDGRNWYTTVK